MLNPTFLVALLKLLTPGLSPWLIYATIAALHAWWALESHDPEEAREHLADSLLHGLLSISHITE